LAIADEEDGWLPLPEAFAQLSDPALWQAWQAAQAAPSRLVISAEPWLGRHSHYFQTAERRRRPSEPDQRALAWKALVRDFKHRLRSGELLASGVDVRLQLNAQRQAIPAELWDVLKLNVGRAQAQVADLKLLLIRVRHAEHSIGVPVPAATLEDAAMARGRPGPRSLMPRVAEEMRARAKRGALKDTVSEECRALENWVKITHPHFGRLPKYKSIRNKLGELYNKLKQE